MKKEDFEFFNEEFTLGKLKNSEIVKEWKRIGGFDVALLKDFLNLLPKEENGLSIGIYISKKKLAPLHCKGFVLSPLIPGSKSEETWMNNSEF